MARIRSIKPEFWPSEQVMNLSMVARLAFIGMWTFCDDGGNHPASPKTLKAEVFPSDDITSGQVQALVDEMLGQGLLVVYEADGKQFWHVTGWHHQRIDKPTLKHPPFSESSKTDPVVLAEPSPSTTGGLPPGVEGIGEDGMGEDVNTDAGASAPASKTDDKGKPSKRKPPTTTLPPDFEVSAAVRRWAEQKGHRDLEAHLEYFCTQAQAKGYVYSDWDAAFRLAISKNWAGLQHTASPMNADAPFIV